MKEISLSKGQVALVDDEDFEWLNESKWHAAWDKHTKSYYAVRWTKDGKRRVRMHRQILGLEYEDPRIGDHRKPNETLNNQRSNLRIANSGSESTANQGITVRNTTGYKGVSKDGNGYRAQLKLNGKNKYLGIRPTPEAAHALRWTAAQEAFGEFARAV